MLSSMIKRTPVRTPLAVTSEREAEQELIERVKAKLHPTKAIVPDKSVALEDLLRSAQTEAVTDSALGEIDKTDPKWIELTTRLTMASCAFFAQEMLSGPSEAPYCGKFFINEHHLEWDELITHHKRLCVLAPRDHSKCQRGDALILSDSGDRIRIDQWQGGYLWAYDFVNNCFVKAYAPKSRSNGVRDLVHIKTRSGREVFVTRNHPLRLIDKWLVAEQLKVGQRIAVPYQSPHFGNTPIPDAWLLGLLVGDGGLSGSNVTLTSCDADVVKHAATFGYKLSQTKHDKNTYLILKAQKRMREVGLMGKTAHTKRVPACIFTGSIQSISEFLSGYLDSDGCVNKHGGGAVYFSSVSKGLLKDIQHLFTRLGVISVITQNNGTYKGKPYKSWLLNIRGKDVITLEKYLSPKGKRKNKLEEIIASQKKKGVCSGNALDLFPKEIHKYIFHSEDWFRKNKFTRPNKQYEMTRAKIRSLAIAESNEGLLSLADAPVFWDKIVSIEFLDPEETWSIHVPFYENYLADDIINHNTFFFDFAFPLWAAIKFPKESGFIFSATQDQATRILTDIKTEIETNPKLRWLMPTKKEEWSITKIRLSNGHRIYARGFGTKIRGAHPRWIVVDDVLNDETAYSELIREKQKDYFFTAITNMIVPSGQIIVVGTPFHADDLYSDLEHNPEYVFRRYRAETNPGQPDNRPLWKERYTLEMLEKRKKEIGSIRYTREFLCDPISDDMSIFPAHLFKGELTEQFNLTLGMSKEFWDRAGVTIFMGVDFAMSTSVKADYTVVWVMGVDGAGNRWIIDIAKERGMAYQAQLSAIKTLAVKYDPAIIFLESNQMQRIFGDELIRTSDLPIRQFQTGVQKHSLERGVPSLRVLLENKKFRIPRGDARSITITDDWIGEMKAFTWSEGSLKSVSGHDDMVMACWICDQAIRQGGFQFSFGDEADYTRPMTPDEYRNFIDGLTGLPSVSSTDKENAISKFVDPEWGNWAS